METIEKRADMIKEVTGEDNAERVRLDITKLLDSGLLVDIDLHGFHCFQTRVDWKELGIPESDERKERFGAGTKSLAPKVYTNRYASLEIRFRQSLESHSFNTKATRPWHWLPFTAYQQWKAEWDALNGELTALNTDFIAHYDEIVEENRVYFQSVARKAWKSFKLQAAEAIQLNDGRAFVDYQDFEDYIVGAALAKLPTREFIAFEIRADYRTGYMVTPPELTAQFDLAAAAKATAAKADAEARLAWQAEREKDLTLTTQEIEQRARAAAVREAELEHTRQQLASITSPLQEVAGQFRARIYEAVVGAAESLKRNGHIKGNTATMLSGLSALYATLASATNDTELQTALSGLDSALSKAGAKGEGKYNLEAVSNALEALSGLTEEAGVELARGSIRRSSRGAALEL